MPFKRHKFSRFVIHNFLIAVVVPLIIFTFIGVQLMSTFLEKEIQSRNDQVAHQVALRTHDHLKNAYDNLLTLRDVLETLDPDQYETLSTLMRLSGRNHMSFVNLTLSNRKGHVVLVEPNEPLLMGIDVSTYESVAAVMAGGSFMWSGVFDRPITLEPVVTLSLPVWDSHVLTASVSTRFFQNLIDDTVVDTSTFLGITDHSGQFVAHNQPHDEARIIADFPLNLSLINPGQTIKIGLNTFQPSVSGIDDFEWHAVIFESKASIKQGVFTFVLWLLLGGFIALLVAMVLVRRVLKTTQKAYWQVLEKTHEIKQGHYTLKEGLHHFEEVQILFDAFNDMTHEINLRKSEINKKQEEIEEINLALEQRIQDRTTRLINANLYLEKTLKDLKDTQDQLVETEKMAALGNLVAGVAHEINTPLGVSLTAVSYLEKEASQIKTLFEQDHLTKNDFSDFLETTLESVSIALSNIDRAAELIKSFKLIAVDQSTANERLFNLEEYVDETIRSLEPQFRHSQIKIKTDIDPMIFFNTNPGDVAQIVTNFVMNAWVHAFGQEKKGSIIIHASPREGVILLTCRDDGLGMPEHVKELIFEPFFTTKRGQGGSGLGLNIVYNIVTQKFNGSISCESQVGKGTTFTVTIPLSDKIFVRS